MNVPHAARRVDLNADLGEEITDDVGLLDVITSANVACGAHAGSPEVMRRVCELAVARGVSVGAHVSYVDRANFGRSDVDVAPDVLSEQVAEQLGLLRTAAEAAGTRVSYVKPHGALYHRAARDPAHAAAVLAATGDLPLLGMRGAVVLHMAEERGRSTRSEGFPDRAYTAEGGLVPRHQPGAVLEDPAVIAESARALAALIDSLCVHGDTPGAVGIARGVRRRLVGAGWHVESCW